MPKVLLAPVGADNPEAFAESPCMLTALVLEAALRGAGIPADVFLYFDEFWPTARRRLLAQVTERQYDIIALSFMSYNRLEAYDLLRNLEQVAPHCRIILGGVHASFLYAQLLREFANVRAVAIGEGEQSLVEFCRHPEDLESIPSVAYRASDGQVRVNPRLQEWRVDLDQQPMLDYTPLKGARGPIPVQTSRGCVGQCVFCAWRMMERTVRTKSPERIVKEWGQIRELFGPDRRIVVLDACYNASSKHVKAMCRALIDAGMTSNPWDAEVRAKPVDREMLELLKQAGCKRLLIGVETGNEEIRKNIGKDISNQDIQKMFALAEEVKMATVPFLVIGLPGETEQTATETIEFVRALRPYYSAAIAPAHAYPGSGLWEIMKKRGLIHDEYWLYGHPKNWGHIEIGGNMPVFTAEHSLIEIITWYNTCYRGTIWFEQNLPFGRLIMNDEEYDQYNPWRAGKTQLDLCHLLSAGFRGTWKGRVRRVVRGIRAEMQITPARLRPGQPLAVSIGLRVHRPADVYLFLLRPGTGSVLSVRWGEGRMFSSKEFGPFIGSLSGNCDHAWTDLLDPAWGFQTPGRYAVHLIVCGAGESVFRPENWLDWRKRSFEVCS